MSQTLEAVVNGGALTLSEPLDLPEGTRVHITVKALPKEEVLPENEDEEPRPKTGAEVVAYMEKHNLFGIWGDADEDSLEIARRLRRQIETPRYALTPETEQ